MESVVIYGTGKLAQMVYYLMQSDARYQVVAFAADSEYCTEKSMLGVPLCPVDTISSIYSPNQHRMISVIGGLTDRTIRKVMFDKASSLGYKLINYIHPTAIIEGSMRMGRNNIIFPYCTLGFSGQFGDNNIVREKVYLGHDFIVGNHCFLGVGCSIGGETKIGDFSYIAMETAVKDHTAIAPNTFIGMGSLVLDDTIEGMKYYGRPAKAALKSGDSR